MEAALADGAVAERGARAAAAGRRKWEEEEAAERSEEGRSAASHPSHFYWVPLKHLQLAGAGEDLGLHSPLSTLRLP